MMIGVSQNRKCRFSYVILIVYISFSSSCELWCIKVFFYGVELLLCCGEFYIIFQLRKVLIMKMVWNSIWIGVSRIENRIFSSSESVMWINLLYFFGFLYYIRIIFSSFGRNSSIMVEVNSVMVSLGCYCGYIGNS